MDKKVAIIGAAPVGMLGHIDEGKATVVVVDTPTQYLKEVNNVIEDSTNFIITHPSAQLHDSESKQFVCKGSRHQYREVEGNWICQCGKRL